MITPQQGCSCSFKRQSFCFWLEVLITWLLHTEQQLWALTWWIIKEWGVEVLCGAFAGGTIFKMQSQEGRGVYQVAGGASM